MGWKDDPIVSKATEQSADVPAWKKDPIVKPVESTTTDTTTATPANTNEPGMLTKAMVNWQLMQQKIKAFDQDAIKNPDLLAEGVVQGVKDLGTGLKQTGYDVRDTITNTPNSPEREATRLDLLRSNDTEAMKNSPAYSGGKFIGKVGPTLSIPGGAVTQEGKGVIAAAKGIAKGSATGGAATGATGFLEGSTERVPEGVSPLMNRLQGIKDDFLMGAGFTAGVGTAIKGAGKAAEKYAEVTSKINPDKVEKRAAESMQNLVGADKEKVISDIEQSQKDFPNVNFTTGQATDNTKVKQFEKALRTKQPTDFIQKDEANKAEATKLFTKQNPKGSVDKIKEVAAKDYNDTISSLNKQIDDSEAQLAGANKELSTAQEGVNQPGLSKADTSTKADTDLRNTIADAREKKNKLFKAIDPNRDVMVGTVPLTDLVNNIASQSPIAKEVIDNSAARFITKNAKKPMSFAEINEYRTALSQEITDAVKNGDGKSVEILSPIRKELDSYTDKLAEGVISTNIDAAQRAKDALDYYKNTYAARLLNRPVNDGKAVASSEVKNFMKKINSGATMSPAETLGKFFKSGAGGGDALDDFFRAMPDKDAAKNIVTDYALKDLEESLKGKPTVGGIDKWMQGKQEALKRLPELTDEINNLKTNIGKAGDNVNAAESIFKETSKSVNTAKKEYEKSAIARVANSDNITGTIKNILNSDKAVTDMAELVSKAKTDTSGSAMEGLKQAVYDHLDEAYLAPVRGGSTENVKVTLGKVEKLLKKKSSRDALELVYGKEGVSDLQKAHQILNKMDFSEVKALPGSETAERLGTTETPTKDTTLSNFGRLVGKSSLISLIKGVVPDVTDELLQKSLKEAMLDPEKAKLLLKMDTAPKSVTTKDVNRFLEENTKLIVRPATEATTDSEDKSTEK